MTHTTYRILSCDGGGIRGVITAKLLQALDPSVIKNIDLFAGTSTGSIIALGLASGVPIDDRRTVQLAELLLEDLPALSAFGQAGPARSGICGWRTGAHRHLGSARGPRGPVTRAGAHPVVSEISQRWTAGTAGRLYSRRYARRCLDRAEQRHCYSELPTECGCSLGSAAMGGAAAQQSSKRCLDVRHEGDRCYLGERRGASLLPASRTASHARRQRVRRWRDIRQ